MAKYRQYIEIEAVQWTGKNPTEVRNFTGVHTDVRGRSIPIFIVKSNTRSQAELLVERLHGWVSLSLGDYIVKTEHGFEKYTRLEFLSLKLEKVDE